MQLLIQNNLGGTWRRICSPEIRSVSALAVLRKSALQIDIYLLTYLLTYLHGVAYFIFPAYLPRYPTSISWEG